MATTMGSIDLKTFKDLRDDVTQYFWFESNSSASYGAGVHITLSPESTFKTTPSGQNILMNTDGISIRNGLLPMMVLDNDSLDFNTVDTVNGTYTNIATFGTTGARIGELGGAHSVIDASGQRFYASNGTTQLANIGYGEGQGESGTTVAPYYTLGTRRANTVIGNYSFAEGYGVTASGIWSHAEGYFTQATNDCAHAEGSHTTASSFHCHAEGSNTIASGTGSHAEGSTTVASGTCSHAEGSTTVASGNYSHAEGGSSTASGEYAHAQGRGTIAQGYCQTAIGRFNVASNTDLFIIGNGDYDEWRTNALLVDWDGAIHLASSLFTECNYDSTGGYEFSRKASRHIVVGGYHVCWGMETISHTASGYKEVQVTLPYTYTSTPNCFASFGNRPTGGAARTAYATQGSLAGNKIYVGSYATGSVTAYVHWMTIGV